MRHVIKLGLAVGLVVGLAACKKPAEPAVQAAPAATAPDEQTGTVERTTPPEQ